MHVATSTKFSYLGYTLGLMGLILASCQKIEPQVNTPVPLKVDTTACLGRAGSGSGPSGCRTALTYALREGQGPVNGCLIAVTSDGATHRRPLSVIDGRITLIDDPIYGRD